jgi:hypothetical protein
MHRSYRATKDRSILMAARRAFDNASTKRPLTDMSSSAPRDSIATDSEIRLSSDPLGPANAGSAFLDEIYYLQKAGYTLQEDRMVP